MLGIRDSTNYLPLLTMNHHTEILRTIMVSFPKGPNKLHFLPQELRSFSSPKSTDKPTNPACGNSIGTCILQPVVKLFPWCWLHQQQMLQPAVDVPLTRH